MKAYSARNTLQPNYCTYNKHFLLPTDRLVLCYGTTYPLWTSQLVHFPRHSVPLIVSLSIAAVTGCPGGYRPPMRQEWHAPGHGKRYTLYYYYCYYSDQIRTRWAEHVAYIGEKRKAESFGEKPKGNKLARSRNRWQKILKRNLKEAWCCRMYSSGSG